MKNILINHSKLLFLFASMCFMTSCEETLIGPAVLNTPQTNFEEMWKSYDQYLSLIHISEPTRPY